MATEIGFVKAIVGEVTATAADGSSRILKVGDRVYADEMIATGLDGIIQIEFTDGSTMDMGRSSQAMLNRDVFDPDLAGAEPGSEELPDDVAAIQQALLEGEDPTEIAEATAAGAGVTGTGNEGHEPVFVDYLNPEVIPDAGFDTVGVTNEYDLPEEDIIIVDEALPTLSINDVTVIEPDGGFLGGTSGNYNIIYILDVSGSMGSGTRLADMKQAIISLNQQIIDAGIADDTEIAIIPFSSGIDGGGTRAPTFYTTADLDANTNGINDIEEYINALFASGGTAFTPPLEVAEDWLDGTLDGTVRYEDSNNIIFFISDGVGSFDVNDPDIQALYDSSTINAQIISIGISEGANLTILDAVDDQDDTNDSAIQVLNTSDLESVLTDLVQGGGGGGGSTSGSVIVEFTVTLSSPSDVDVMVNFTTANGTAISGGTGVAEDDYGATSGTVTIPAGSTSATIQVTVYDDNVTEFTEQYLVQLGTPVNAEIADGTGVGTILDNDPVDFSIFSTESIDEDNEETATFTVNMDGILAVGVTASVQLDLGTGTATDAVDYDAFEAAIVAAAAGETGVSYNAATNVLTFDSDFDGSFDFTVDAINDQLVEGTETIIGELSNATVTGGYGVATISVPSTTTDITENDQAITITIADTQETITEEGGETNTFTISLSEAMNAGNTVTVDVDFLTGTDTEDADFVTAALASLQAAADATTGVSFDGTTLTYDDTFVGTDLSFAVTAFDDDLLDSPETLNVTLSNATATNGTATAADSEDVTITDVDQAITITIADTQETITEEGGETDTFTISLSEAINTGNTVTVDVDFLTGTDTEDADFVTAALASLQAAADATTGVSFDGTTLTYDDTFVGTDLSFAVTAFDDDLLDSPETLNVTLSNATAVNGTATAADSEDVTITDVDQAITITIADTQETITEEGGETDTFTISLSEAINTGNTVTVDVDFLTGTDTEDADFVTAALASLQAAADATTGVSFDGTTLTYDDTFVGTDLSFAVTAFDDDLLDSPETLNVTLSNATATNGTATAADSEDVTITDTDQDLTITIADTQETITEEGGETDTFTISLSEAINTGNTVTVDVDFLTGTDTEDADFVTAALASLQAAADATTGVSFDGTTLTYDDTFVGTDLSFAVTAFDDDLLDSPETLNVTLSNATAVNGTATAADSEDVTITDTDQDLTITIADTQETISEEEGETNTFTISLSEAMNAGNTVTVDVDFLTGTDTEDADFVTAALASLQAAADATTGVSFDGTTLTYDDTFVGTDLSFAVTAFDDDLLDSPETLNVTLSNATATNGTATAADSEDVTITDVDQAITITIADTQETITEEGGETDTFTISLSEAMNAGNTVTVDVDFLTGTDTEDADFVTAALASLQAAADATTGVSFDGTTLTYDDTFVGTDLSFSVTAFNDDLLDSPETLNVTLSNATAVNGTATAADSEDVTITDIDAAVTFAVNVSSEDAANDSPTQSATIAEELLSDNQGTFTITKGGDPLTGSNTATVTITVTGSAEDDDFIGMSGTDYADVVAAIKAAAEAAGLIVTNDDGDSLEVTWVAGDTASFDVDLTAFDDDLLDPESLTLTLSGASVDEGTAMLESGEEAATLNITDVDAEPTAGAVSALVDDDGLSAGIPDGTGDDTPDADPDNDESTYSGTLTHDFGDNGAGSIDFAEMHGDTGSLGTEDIVYSWDAGSNTLTATTTSGSRIGTDLFNVTVNPATGAYTVTLLTNVLHDSLDGEAGDNTENNDSVVLTYTVRDSDTDTADGTLTVDFDDDTPVALDDSGNVTEGATLDVLAAAGVLINDQSGADGYDGAIVGVVTGNDDGTDTINGDVGNTINGTYGMLTLNADGSYTYESTANAIDANAQDQFVYTIRDGDGDLTSAVLTINLADVTGTPVDTVAEVDEAGLSPLGTSAGDGSNQVVGGSLSFSGGFDNVAMQNGSTALGSWTVYADGTFDYTLNVATDDLLGDETDSFSYTATDDNGNSVSNTVTVTIIDDEPVFTIVNDGGDIDDVVSLVTQNPTADMTYFGNFADWAYGADDFGSLSASSLPAGVEVDSVAVDGSQIVLNFYEGEVLVATLTLNADGQDSLDVFRREPEVEFIPVATAAAEAGGPVGSILVDLEAAADFNILVTATKGGVADDVNASTQGWGVDNQNINTDETITFSFVDDGDNTTPYGISDFKFQVTKWTGGFNGAVAITVVFIDADTMIQSSETLQFASVEDAVITISELGWSNYEVGDDLLSVKVVHGNATSGGAFNINGVEVGAESVTPPDDLSYEGIVIDVVDGDGDMDSQEFSLAIDGDEGDGLEVEAITGTSGNDVLLGTVGDDFLIGGAGDDILTGDSGADTFEFSMAYNTGLADEITDFEIGTDTLSFSDVMDVNDDTNIDFADVVASIENGGPTGDLTINMTNGGSVTLTGLGTADPLNTAAQLESYLGNININTDS